MNKRSIKAGFGLIAIFSSLISGCYWGTKQTELCTSFKLTQIELGIYAQAFYPEIVPSGYYWRSDDQLEMIRAKDESSIQDAWKNAFILGELDGKLVLYSMGVNGVDDQGQGDDIVFGDQKSKNQYCSGKH